MGSNDEKLNEMVIKLGKYVPYRLIRPFYDDFIKDKEYKICKRCLMLILTNIFKS